MKMNMLVLIFFLMAMCFPFKGIAGDPPPYRYGDAWWEEYLSDKNTALLLHFGKPSVVEKIEKKVIDEDNENDLADTEIQEPVDDSNVPADTVLDYSINRRVLKLSAGAKITKNGRFGDGLSFDGNGSLFVDKAAVGPVECWFKVDELPKKPACIFSLSKDECRLMLNTDGRLELILKKPHGTPDAKLAADVLADIMAKNAVIITEISIKTGVWNHVIVYNKIHVVQGAGSPFDATIKLNGYDVANYMSENNNSYQFMGRNITSLMLGNNFTKDHGFTGIIDETRISDADRNYYEKPEIPWRELTPKRKLQFNKPYFRNDGTVLHASFDKGVSYEIGSAGGNDIKADLKDKKFDDLLVDGIRGKAFQADPVIGFPRLVNDKMNGAAGSLEFWLRPFNWDDCTGYWQHSPPKIKDLSVARFYGKDAQDGKTKQYLSIAVPRAFNNERSRVPMDPGHWQHFAFTWGNRNDGKASLFVNGQYYAGVPYSDELAKRVTPQYIEFGIADKITVKRDEKPIVEIDEVVGYNYALAKDEVEQAAKRWKGDIEPIRLYNDNFSFKWSLQRMEYTISPMLQEGVTPVSATAKLVDTSGKIIAGPVTADTLKDNKFYLLLSDGKNIAYGKYKLIFNVVDDKGKTVIDGTREWNYEEEPWRNFKGGIVDKVPSPWTPIVADKTSVATRMTTYKLGIDGLPAQIMADGVNILAAPFMVLEDGKPITGTMSDFVKNKDTEADWTIKFAGATCDLLMKCHAEYDGMIRYSINVKPKGKVGKITFAMPVKSEFVKRYLYYPMGDRGVRNGVAKPGNGTIFESRYDPVPYANWKEYLDAKKKNDKLTWEEFWTPKKPGFKRYNFYGHLDLNDMNRGLWWFCDNANGWVQSKEVSAIEVIRKGDTATLNLNLVAESSDYKSDRPIIFAILPHPARPMAEKYRLYNRVSPAIDNKASDIFDAFRPWPADPRYANTSHMALYPSPDPKKPEAGPSWEYAESCVPNMKNNKPTGMRTMYLSKAWFSCRAGAYDGWEWRSGESGSVSLTPSFVNYLSWEMNEWIKRGIWEAIYLDECYEMPTSNVEAGQATLLPDGTIQPGVTNFQFRELMKRWRNLFTENGKEPTLIAHHTYSWQYPGILYCDAYLDGENRPIVSLRSKDWIDSTGMANFEVVQNCRLWGNASFYMPFIAEGGFDDKDRSKFPKWQWRMARQAQSQFAHYEVATVYEGQGRQVYQKYWDDIYRWGAEKSSVTFHPYWDNAKAVQVEGQGENTLVSYYHDKGRILLIISNRMAEDRVIKVNLNKKALGLADNVVLKLWDSSFIAPPGLDNTPEKVNNDPDDPEVIEVPDPPMVDFDIKPSIDNDVITIPIRAKDFRMMSIE